MRKKSKAGFSLVELVVLVVVGVLFFAAWIPCAPVSNAVLQANMTATVARGRDIYVAIAGANAERAALGLPPLWPRDVGPAADTNVAERTRLEFGSSTAYFSWLADEENRNTQRWSPRAAGFDYTKLAGAGVPACPKGQGLTAERNMWTIAKNVRDDTDGMVPVLITRNIEASSLAARVDEPDFKGKALRFDPGWSAPFGDQGFVLIRKGGATFKARPKYMSYGVVYQRCAFDTARTTNGVAGPPLKYLTPTREVALGERAYAEGAAVAYQLAGGRREAVKRAIRKAVDQWFVPVVPVAAALAVWYLTAFFKKNAERKGCGQPSLKSAPVIGVWICHYLAVTCFVVGMSGAGGDGAWVIAVAALVAQAVGVLLALVFQRHDPETRNRQIKWLLAPLGIVLLGGLLIGLLCSAL